MRKILLTINKNTLIKVEKEIKITAKVLLNSILFYITKIEQKNVVVSKV